jgi:tRNA threonylcarbamoyladenosine biosynthesis protein TsaE
MTQIHGKSAVSLKRHCRQEADTADLAKQLAGSFEQYILQNPGSHINISLMGDLGAGKTTFTRHLIQSLGYAGKVKSPTYTLCEPYSLGDNEQRYFAHHFDLYRMRDPLEWQEAGFAELFDTPGFCIIEWPEKAEGTLPAFDIQIEMLAGPDENERSITMNALSANGAIMIKNMAQ